MYKKNLNQYLRTCNKVLPLTECEEKCKNILGNLLKDGCNIVAEIIIHNNKPASFSASIVEFVRDSNIIFDIGEWAKSQLQNNVWVEFYVCTLNAHSELSDPYIYFSTFNHYPDDDAYSVKTENFFEIDA